MKLAIDAMGGDNAPQVVVEGVMAAIQQFDDIECILYGDEAAIRQYLTDETRVTIVHTDECITYDEEPVRAVRRKKQASLVLAAKAVKEGEADAMLSGGNTGALLAAGLLYVGRMPQIERPGLMTTLPVIQNDKGFDLLDLGANAESKPEYLNHYATMGSIYASHVRGIDNPRVGLLNNGTEEGKGNDLTKEAYTLLAQNPHINFIGNVEARELLNNVADVVVVDGFTGNAVLKSTEGTALSILKLMKQSVMESGLLAKLGALLMKPALKKVQAKMDYTSHNGAILMGVKAPVVKTHGSSTKDTIVACIDQIHTMLEEDVITVVRQALEAQVND